MTKLREGPDARAIHVLMLGESLDRQGGIVTVQKVILDEADDRIAYRHIATLPPGSTTRKVAVFARALLRLSWALLKDECDLVHIHVSDRGSAFRQTITASLSQLFGKPVVMHTHAGAFHDFYPRLPEPIRRTMGAVFRRCACLIALSESWRTFYVRVVGMPAERVAVLYNPVPLPPVVPERPAGELVRLVCLGRIVETKGSYDLIRAVAALAPELRQRIRLIMAGDGEAGIARQLVQELALGEQITVLDWIDAAKRDALLAAADIFVLPSYHEGLPMALLEAMSWGLPAITTPVGGIPELIQQDRTGLLVAPGAVAELAAAITCLAESSEQRRRLGQAARACVEPYGAARYVSRLTELYQSLLAKPLRAPEAVS